MKNLQTCRVNIMVSNMDQAIHFYQETLELTLLNRFGDHYAEVQAPDLLIGIHPAKPDTVFGNNMAIGLGVTAFDETIQNMKDKGLTLDIAQDGWIRLAHFQDPDGNLLFLAERKD